MSSRDRALSIIELLARQASGLPLSDIADQLRIPRSATHRLLADLRDTGYVRQDHDGGIYQLTAKLVALSMAYSSGAGITDMIRPILDQLAAATGELAMLCVLEGDTLLRAAKAQGARRGLVYNPEEASEVFLPASANGHALLSCYPPEKALEMVARQGFRREGYGPRAPQSIAELVVYLDEARLRGYAMTRETFEVGAASMAAPIFAHDARVPIGSVSVSGPLHRMGEEQEAVFAPLLLAAARDLGLAAKDTTLFNLRHGRPVAAENRPAEKTQQV